MLTRQTPPTIQITILDFFIYTCMQSDISFIRLEALFVAGHFGYPDTYQPGHLLSGDTYHPGHLHDGHFPPPILNLNILSTKSHFNKGKVRQCNTTSKEQSDCSFKLCATIAQSCVSSGT